MQVSTSKVEHLPSSESNQFYLFPSTDGTGGQGSEVEGFSMGTSISTLGTHDGATIIHTNTQQRESAKEFSWLDPKSDGTDLLRWSGPGLSFNLVLSKKRLFDNLIWGVLHCGAQIPEPGRKETDRENWMESGGGIRATARSGTERTKRERERVGTGERENNNISVLF